MTDKLIILNLPHPRGLSRELARPGSEQAKNSSYARNFQKEGSEKLLTAESLAAWVTDPAARAKYVEAFQRSSFAAMMSYYKRNYPREPYQEDTSPVLKVKAPVLEIHGLKDTYLLAGALDGTWNWVEKDFTLVTVPNAAHFVQQDASALVTRTMRDWLTARQN
jgi:pimeloyl-ACP methyl ester carboxylesterase